MLVGQRIRIKNLYFTLLKPLQKVLSTNSITNSDKDSDFKMYDLESSEQNNSIIDDKNEFVLDKILEQRWKLGKIQYLLRLRSQSQIIKVWIFDEDLTDELRNEKRQINLINHKDKEQKEQKEQKYPIVDQIIDVKKINGLIMFDVKWLGSDVHSTVPASILKKNCPSKIIEFYELNYDTIKKL